MKELSETGAEDILLKVGGRQWVETLDVCVGNVDLGIVGEPLQWCDEGDFPGWHICVTNADVRCYQLDFPPGESFSGGKIYTPLPYQRDDVAENNGANGAVVTSVRLGDTGGVIADFMDRTGGLVGLTVFLSFHWAVGSIVQPRPMINISYPEVTYEFVVKETSHDRTYAKVALATALPLDRQWPPRKTSKAKCRWVFKGCECQYDGEASTCERTIAACRALGNIAHFGAFPGCGVGGLAQ